MSDDGNSKSEPYEEDDDQLSPNKIEIKIYSDPEEVYTNAKQPPDTIESPKQMEISNSAKENLNKNAIQKPNATNTNPVLNIQPPLENNKLKEEFEKKTLNEAEYQDAIAKLRSFIIKNRLKSATKIPSEVVTQMGIVKEAEENLRIQTEKKNNNNLQATTAPPVKTTQEIQQPNNKKTTQEYAIQSAIRMVEKIKKHENESLNKQLNAATNIVVGGGVAQEFNKLINERDMLQINNSKPLLSTFLEEIPEIQEEKEPLTEAPDENASEQEKPIKSEAEPAETSNQNERDMLQINNEYLKLINIPKGMFFDWFKSMPIAKGLLVILIIIIYILIIYFCSFFWIVNKENRNVVAIESKMFRNLIYNRAGDDVMKNIKDDTFQNMGTDVEPMTNHTETPIQTKINSLVSIGQKKIGDFLQYSEKKIEKGIEGLIEWIRRVMVQSAIREQKIKTTRRL